MERQSKQKQIESRVSAEANYIINAKFTIRQISSLLGISKSTVHKDMTDRLNLISEEKARKVKAVLEFNKSQRHLRGGLATKLKYQLN